MASISSDGNGLKRILFVNPEGKRKAIRLGKMTMKQAERWKIRIEDLVTAGIGGGGIGDDTAAWLEDLDDKMHARLAAVGLVRARNRGTGVTLGGFLQDYFAHMTVKPQTAVFYGHTRRNLTDYFGESRLLQSIEPAEADKWRQWLKSTEALADATIARRVKAARGMFTRARKWKLIRENPFADVKAGSQTNKDRQFFVTRDIAGKVLDACPDAQWRLLFALSRYGGLRCPSEHLALRWGDVDWEGGKIRVTSCKTEHLEGGGCRYIPLFPELRGPLMEVFEQAPEGSEYVITRYRETNKNLRTQFGRILRRAGVVPWPRLFHNLRATRQTELAETHPIHVVCAWIGNSQAVAQEHYLQVTDEHFIKAAQNPAQYPSGSTGMGDDSPGSENQQAQSVPALTDQFNCLPVGSMGPEGFEPPTKRL